MTVPTGLDVTDTVFDPGPAPADLDTLRADATYGDGVYAGPAFEPFEYVVLGDATRVAYDPYAAAWFLGQMVPTVVPDGEIIADRDTLKALIRAKSDADDEQLDDALAASSHWVYDRVMVTSMTHHDVQLAILLLAGRLYKRPQSPEGVAGFGIEGVVVRVAANDPDINRLLERHLDMSTLGIG